MKGEVLVIGLGLIGGSLAMAIRQAHSDVHIVGYDVNAKNIQLAQLLGIIDQSVDSIEEACFGSGFNRVGCSCRSNRENPCFISRNEVKRTSDCD